MNHLLSSFHALGAHRQRGNTVIDDLEILRQEHIAELRSLKDEAVAMRAISAALKAEELIGRVQGLYTTKTEITGAGGGPVEITIVKTIVDPLT